MNTATAVDGGWTTPVIHPGAKHKARTKRALFLVRPVWALT